jgi:hypothetical protein
MTIQIEEDLFWSMYNALHDAESVLWRCDGEVNPENLDLNEELIETHEMVANVVDKLQPIIEDLKEDL